MKERKNGNSKKWYYIHICFDSIELFVCLSVRPFVCLHISNDLSEISTSGKTRCICKPKLMPYARASFPSRILGWMLAYRFKERPEDGVGWEVCSTQCGNIKLLARVFEWIFIVLWYSARSIFAAIKMLPFFYFPPPFFLLMLIRENLQVCLSEHIQKF